VGSQYSVVGITTRLWAGQSWAQIPVGSRDFSLLWSIQIGSEAHQASYFMGKAKQSHYRAWGFENIEVPRFQDSWHMKVVKLSAISIGNHYPIENIPGTRFCQRLSQPHGHSMAGRIMSMEKFQWDQRGSIQQPFAL
jgi:hypothetical protein